ncbi:TPA: tape measure protein [Stenotrophomonas maltophilia]|uniref:Tape measure protein n=1 Tax=Stenotrophomonas maltophilia TaxID=40324 RepID=A0AAI9G3X4_STEMA|nr:tape measure protein [Stenotrophomonas maltophilia]EKZ1926189.1 tape measure protein [Stenotrophomonas maltophilia]EMB2743923.1 tape measure protein [Stenotrophomonas maltophilia]MBH1418357.1 tape measure protein [Stenotrophomonas maltophilia]MBH1685561.1 tape measure protein [Stenotrophomonas maltophilia]MBH1812793.1 tape measure protein [Stenotrophomonas maltophilia]
MSLYTLTVDLLLKSGSFERDSGKAARVVQRDMAAIQSSMSDAARRGADEVAAGFRRVAFEAVGLTSALVAVKAAVGKADEWTNLNNRLRLVTQGQAQFAAAQADVIRIAGAARQPLGATAELYQRIAMNQEALGLSGSDLARVVETISKTMVISGTSAAGADAALVQLGQAFASGTLRGEELNSVLEQAPALAQAIAKGLNVPIGKLRELGAAGKLSSEQVINALQNQAGAVDDAFGKMDSTVGQAMTLFNNNLQVMIGRADEATGASKLLAAGIGALGSNLESVAVAGAAVASGPLLKALLARVAAANAGMAADRAAAAQNLAAAQQLELRTRAAMLDAEAEVRRAAAIGGSVSVSSKAAAATLEHRQATLLLAQAQTQAAAANAGWVARAGASTLAMLGGPSGIITMLATAAAGWLIFRDNTKTASAALIDFSGAADTAIEKFKTLNAQIQAGEILRLQKEMSKGYDELNAAVNQMVAVSSTEIGGPRFKLYVQEVGQLRAEFQAGKITADQFSASLAAANTQLLEGAPAAKRIADKFTEQTASAASLAQSYEQQNRLLTAFTGATNQATTATDALSGSFNALGDSAGAAGKRIASAMQSLPGQLARVGKSAAEVAKLDVGDWFKEAQASGVDFSKRDDPKVRQYIEQGAQYIRLQTELAAAQKNFTESRKASAAAERAGAKDRKADAEAIKRYNEQAAMAAATMAGPLAEATERQKQLEDKLKEAVKEGRIERAAYNTLVLESQKALEQSSAEIKKALASPESLLATMDTEVAMLGKVGRARELSRRQMMNERDMRQELQKAVEAAGSKEELARRKGVASYEAYEQAMLAAARASADLSLRVEEAAANVEAWASVLVYGVGDAADAMADFVAGGMRDFDNLWDDLQDAAKRGLRDLAREFLQQKLVIPIQTQILNGISGQGGGLSLQSLMGVLGGNGSAAGGQNVSTVAGLLSKGQGLFGFGRSAGAAAGTLNGFGDVTSMAGMTGSSFSGLIGGGSAGTGAGAAGAASSAAAAVPIIGWIVAGMMKNAQLFDQGWNIANGESWAGKIATAGAVGLADKTFRGLGFNDKVASILSGSSIHAKLFGRQAPKVTGQGITGSYGFGGFDGQSYADIKAKGGLFRSDKKWTQFGALDPGIDRTFDMAARQVRGAATDLAKQLGVDLTTQLGAVRVDLGKLQLSADSTEAKAQLEAYLADMTDRLYSEAVRAAGFGGQLDGYFEASDVFTALSASIALAVGNADELGRALNGLEVDKVNKAVDYFQDLASVAGTDLATQVEKVTGLLGNYASLMADVSTQLMTANLTQYQSQALSIERTYRQQVKSANDYAKALGLSGARAEDLAKIEALRATNMGKLQAQIDKDKKAMQYGLSISDLSPLTDQEKLGEAMKELERAVSGGDTSAAQAAAQAALGFGRNLYASGQDYNSLYGRVTGLIDGMKVGDLNQQDGTSMGALADAIEALPDNFSRAVFDLVVNNDAQTQTTAAVQQSNALLAEQNQLLRQLVSTTTQGVRNASSSALREALNAR